MIVKFEMEIITPNDIVGIKKTVEEALRSRYINYQNIKIKEIDYHEEKAREELKRERALEKIRKKVC